MFGFSAQFELWGMAFTAYLFIALLLAGAGSRRACGARKAFMVSFLLTPVAGLFYVLRSPQRSVLKTVHYRCNHCGLEYTSSHRYCRICAKEGHKYRLHRISMRTY